VKKDKTPQLELQFHVPREVHELSYRLEKLLAEIHRKKAEMRAAAKDYRQFAKSSQAESMKIRGEHFQILQRLLGIAGLKKDSMDIAMDGVVNIIQN
jgi:hypothetical protein